MRGFRSMLGVVVAAGLLGACSSRREAAVAPARGLGAAESASQASTASGPSPTDPRPLPEAQRAASAHRAGPARDGQLDWVASWQGPPPQLFARPSDDFLLVVAGSTKLGGRPIVGRAAANSLHFVHLGRDGRVRSSVAVAQPLSWARGLALLNDGDVLAHGAKQNGSQQELFRFHPDGSIVWSHDIGREFYPWSFDVDETSGRIVLGLIPWRPRPDPVLGVTLEHSAPGGPTPARVVVVNGAGTKTFDAPLDQQALAAVALRPEGGFAVAGNAAPVSAIATATALLAPGAAGASASWISAIDASGRSSWVRTLELGAGGRLAGLGVAADGSVFVAGQGSGGTARFLQRFAAARGAPEPAIALPSSAVVRFSTSGEPDYLVERAPDGNSLTYVALDETGQARWSAGLGAMELAGVAALGDGTRLLQGRFPAVLSVPGLGAGPALTSGRPFSFFLALYSEIPAGSTAPAPVPRVLDRALPANDKTSVHSLKRRALRAFRAKRYEQACDLFAQAQNRVPHDSANLGDLGLCLQRAGQAGLAEVVDRHALALAAGTSEADSKVRHAVYHNLALLGVKQKLDFAKSTCLELPSDSPGCDRPIHVCGSYGSYGMDTRVFIGSFTVARFALTRGAADLGDIDPLTWPELGAAEGETTDRRGAPSYDVTLSFDADNRDSNYGTVSQDFAECSVIHIEGCGGRVALACSWHDADSKGSQNKIIELELGGA